MTLHRLNNLPPPARRAAYASLIPETLWRHLATLDPALVEANPDSFHVIASSFDPEVHLRAPKERRGGDFAFSLDLEDVGGGQLEISFIIINDLTAERFNIDVDDYGNVTLLGTAERNMAEERRALAAGLGPCQVRRGLRMFRDFLARMEVFAKAQGYVALCLEPLTYHNAVMYERLGFGYLSGRKRMVEINEGFKPGGPLMALLDGSTPFRVPEHALTPRGRSWAIHDGLLQDYDGKTSMGVQMYKVIGQNAGIVTFSVAM